MELPYLKTITAAIVTVNNGQIKEIELHYPNGEIQTVRPDNL